MAKKDKKLWFSVTAKDCEFQTFRASGNGGQHKNKTDSAVRCIHKASGAVGECTEHKEQKQNKKKAFARMADTKEFKSWLKCKIEAGRGNIVIEHTNNRGEQIKRKLSLDEV